VVIGAVAVSALWFGALARYALSELQRD
jgi:hypothetical protein